MANPRIEVEIGAVTDGLIRGVDGAILSMEELQTEFKKVQDALTKGKGLDATQIGNYNKELARLKAGMQSLKSQGVEPLTKATSTYNGVGVEFSRIIQDAPFGIIGVGNNITRLVETFQNLRASSTSTGAALKTALTSIISPANLLVLGISAVTTALTLWQMGAFDSKEETKSLADAAREAKDELNDYRDSLDGITQARIKGESTAQGEINNFTLLKKQAENANVPLGKRLEAVNELQNKYPDYLGSLSQEQILTGSVGGAYDNLTKSIVATAKARAFSEKISQNSLDLLTIENKEKEKEIELNNLRAKQGTASTFNAAQSGIRGGDLFSEADILAAQIRDKEKEINELKQSTNKITAENLGLEKEISNQINIGATFTNNTKKNNESNKNTLKEVYNIQRELNFEYIKTSDIQDKIASNSKLIVDNLNEPAKILADLNKLNATDFSVGFTPTIEVADVDDSEITKKLLDFRNRILDFQAETSSILSQGAVQGISILGSAIGEALAGGQDAFKNLGKGLLSTLAGILKQLGEAAIKIGVGMIAIKQSFKNPITAIAAGVALVALSSFIGSKVGGIVGGSGGSGSGSVGQGVSGQSFSGTGVSGITGQNRDISGELSVRGSDLVYVFGQAQNKITKG